MKTVLICLFPLFTLVLREQNDILFMKRTITNHCVSVSTKSKRNIFHVSFLVHRVIHHADTNRIFDTINRFICLLHSSRTPFKYRYTKYRSFHPITNNHRKEQSCLYELNT